MAALLHGVILAASSAMLLAALIIRRRTRQSASGNGLEAAGTSALQRATAYGWRPAPSPRPRRIPSTHGSPAEQSIEMEVLERYLVDIRDALHGDDVVLWKRGDHDDLITIASTSGRSAVADFQTSPPAESLAHWALQQGMPASNYDADTALLVAAPVGMEEEQHGAVALYAANRASLSPERVRTYLPRYASRLSLVLDLLRDGRETQRYRGKSTELARAAESIQASSDMATLGEAICQAAIDVSGGSRAAFVIWTPAGDERNSTSSTDAGGRGEIATVSAQHPVREGFEIARDSFVGTACRERQRFIIRESYTTSDFPIFGPGEPARRVSSLAVVPLQRDHRSLGAIAVEGDEVAQLTLVEGSLLLLLSSVASVGLERVRQLEEVTTRAVTDGLTGLPNRRMFDDRLAHHLAECDRRSEVLSLILVDIDHFKQVNDEHGHEAGDRVLAAVSRAIARDIRAIDLCARYGGEELAILLPQTSMERAREVAERLRQAVESLRVPVTGGTISITASFGVASYPHSGAAHDTLFPAADKALYAAKNAGRNQVMSAHPTISSTTI